MMEITKRGTIPEERKWKARCHNCGSEAIANQSEMTNVTYNQREGDSYSWEKCPVCNYGPYGAMLFYPVRM